MSTKLNRSQRKEVDRLQQIAEDAFNDGNYRKAEAFLWKVKKIDDNFQVKNALHIMENKKKASDSENMNATNTNPPNTKAKIINKKNKQESLETNNHNRYVPNNNEHNGTVNHINEENIKERKFDQVSYSNKNDKVRHIPIFVEGCNSPINRQGNDENIFNIDYENMKERKLDQARNLNECDKVRHIPIFVEGRDRPGDNSYFDTPIPSIIVFPSKNTKERDDQKLAVNAKFSENDKKCNDTRSVLSDDSIKVIFDIFDRKREMVNRAIDATSGVNAKMDSNKLSSLGKVEQEAYTFISKIQQSILKGELQKDKRLSEALNSFKSVIDGSEDIEKCNEKSKKEGKRNLKLENSIEVVAHDLLKKAEQAFFDFDLESAEHYLSVSQYLKSDEYTNEIIAMVEKAKHDLDKDEVIELKKKLFRNAKDETEEANKTKQENKTNENVFDVTKMGDAFWTPILGDVQLLLAKIEDYYPDTRAKELFRQIGRASENLRDKPVPANLISEETEKDVMLEAKSAIHNCKYERAECLLKICVWMNPASEAKALLNDVVDRLRLNAYDVIKNNCPNKEESIRCLKIVEKALESKEFSKAQKFISKCERMTDDPVLSEALKRLKSETRKAEYTFVHTLTERLKANSIASDVERAKNFLDCKNFTLAQSIVAKLESTSKTDALLKTTLELIKREATTSSADKYLQIAKEAVGNEDFAQAEACLQAIVKYHPDHAKRLSQDIKCTEQKVLKLKALKCPTEMAEEASQQEFERNYRQAYNKVKEGNFTNALLYLKKCKDLNDTSLVNLKIERIQQVLLARQPIVWDTFKPYFQSAESSRKEKMAHKYILAAEKTFVSGIFDRAALYLARAEDIYSTNRAKMLLQYLKTRDKMA